jgi:epoxyqueuosine reductase
MLQELILYIETMDAAEGRSTPVEHRLPTDRALDSLRARFNMWRHEATATLLTPVVKRTIMWGWLRHLPAWPLGKPKLTPAWPSVKGWQTPEQLRTVPGAQVDPEEQERVLRERPFYDFFSLFPESFVIYQRYGWSWMLRAMRIMQSSFYELREGRAPARPVARATIDPQALTDELRAEGLRLGLNAIGFAAYDPKYTFVEMPLNEGPLSEGSVIVCLVEQDFERTQTIPSSKAEVTAMYSYLQINSRARKLADFLHERGFEAQVQGPLGRLASVPYAIQAGLGQLGLNGQLLSPAVGPRLRICLITTDATLVHDEPVDYGIHAICDECQLCVKRCPPGAIPNKRALYRGVLKAKIKPDRCLPVLAQAHGCAICMKVCPVQRYGLEAVTTHLVETGEILGKGTDELEGYHWLDGRHYGPGQKPRITQEFMAPRGIALDRTRDVPTDVITT